MKASTQEDTMLINTYVPNIGLPKYIKQILTDIKEETDKNTVIIEDLNSLLISIGSPSTQKINMAALVHNRPYGFIDI